MHQKKLDEMGHLHLLLDKMGLDKMGINCTLLLTLGWEELFEVGKKLLRRRQFAIARSGFELFQLCHSHYIMGIRSCELSEPLFGNVAQVEKPKSKFHNN